MTFPTSPQMVACFDIQIGSTILTYFMNYIIIICSKINIGILKTLTMNYNNFTQILTSFKINIKL